MTSGHFLTQWAIWGWSVCESKETPPHSELISINSGASISHILEASPTCCKTGLLKIWFTAAMQFQQPFISPKIVSHEWNLTKH